MHSYYICAYSKPYTVDQYSVWVCIHSLAYLCIHTAWAHVYMTCNRCDSMHVYITVAKDAVDSSYNQIWCLMSLLEKHGTDLVSRASRSTSHRKWNGWRARLGLIHLATYSVR